jgi:hypothetical protein
VLMTILMGIGAFVVISWIFSMMFTLIAAI